MLLRFSEDDPKDPGENVRADDEVPRTWMKTGSYQTRGQRDLSRKVIGKIPEVSSESLFLVKQILLVLTIIYLLSDSSLKI